MEVLGGLIGAGLFLIVFFVILHAGKKATEVIVDTTVDGISKGISIAKPIISNTVKSTEDTLSKISKGVLKPNTFCEVWTLTDFVCKYGTSVGIESHINNTTGKVFHTCEVRNNLGKTYSIRFTASLGELSAQELKDRKDKLFVGKTNNGRYYMYDKFYKEWEEVNLE